MVDLEGAMALARYKSWADDLTLSAVAALPPGEAARERATLFKSIIGTLNHSYVVDLIWQAHLEGRAHGFTARNVVPYPAVEALTAAQRRANDWLLAWSEAQSPASLRAAVSFRQVSGEQGTMSRGEILLHIVKPRDLSPWLGERSLLSGAGETSDHRLECLSARVSARVRSTSRST